MAYLVRPEVEELSFRQKLHASPATMDFAHTEPFPEEEWQTFYDQNIASDPKERFYRYLFCGDCNGFTGEVSWVHNRQAKRYEIFILIASSFRREGYGREAVENLRKAARKAGIPRLSALVRASDPSLGFFEHMGFTETETKDGMVLLEISSK